MKQFAKNILKISVASLFLILVACDDYLNSPPVNLVSTESFYKTPAQAEQAVNGIYSDLRYLSREQYLFMSVVRSDETWVNPLPNAYREFSEIGTFRGGDEVSTYNTTWNRWYKVIADANALLAKLPGIDFSNNTFKDQLEGEARFLRGWAYFELVRLYGNIPIIDRDMSPNEVANVEQSPAKEVYDRMILPDMIKAGTLLPLAAELKDVTGKLISGSGRADKIAARAMLGRIYMTMAGFPVNDASAIALAETELLAVKQFSEQNNNKYWAPDHLEWRKQWMSEYNNKYSIFAIQHRTGGTGNTAIYESSPGLPLSYTSFSPFGNEIWLEKSLMYEFSKTHAVSDTTDTRGIGHTILLGYEKEGVYSTYSNSKDTFHTPSGTIEDVHIRSIPYKYMNSLRKRAELGYTTNIETSMMNTNDWPVNFPVIRLEDVLLMYAEVLVKKNDIAGAMEIVNRIRERAVCDPAVASNAGEAMNAIKRERRIELCFEGIRWFDIIRWGEWKSDLTTMFNRYNNPTGTQTSDLRDGRYLFPIPMTQMDIKPGLYKQNTGY